MKLSGHALHVGRSLATIDLLTDSPLTGASLVLTGNVVAKVAH